MIDTTGGLLILRSCPWCLICTSCSGIGHPETPHGLLYSLTRLRTRWSMRGTSHMKNTSHLRGTFKHKSVIKKVRDFNIWQGNGLSCWLTDLTNLQNKMRGCFLQKTLEVMEYQGPVQQTAEMATCCFLLQTFMFLMSWAQITSSILTDGKLFWAKFPAYTF